MKHHMSKIARCEQDVAGAAGGYWTAPAERLAESLSAAAALQPRPPRDHQPPVHHKTLPTKRQRINRHLCWGTRLLQQCHGGLVVAGRFQDQRALYERG